MARTATPLRVRESKRAEYERKAQERYEREQAAKRGQNWDSRTHGFDDNGNPVTFKNGRKGGPNEGHTLISDGHKSDRQFRKGHNHYGPKREGNGFVNKDRGKYTGPDH